MYSAVKRFFITGPQGKSQQSGHFNDSRWWLGLVLVTAIAFVATYLSHVCLLYTSPSPRD